jgi:hypothetical protein
MFGIDLAGGAVIFLAFVVLYLIATVYGLYTKSGSGISQRPYKHVYGGAPGAARLSRMSGSADRDIQSWSRGTR